MKVTDYIVEFLILKGITDVFGYPGGVICHFIDSLTKYNRIKDHINYHEQASAFAACGYAQESGLPGVAYSTSGPGATNLITGIANAYYDSIPSIFITGQVDTYSLKGSLSVRQRGFQETDVIGIVRPITKYAVRVDDPLRIRYELEKAFYYAVEGNPGPILLDLPADVQRAFVDENTLLGYEVPSVCECNIDTYVNEITSMLEVSKCPCILLGCGMKQRGLKQIVQEIAENSDIPVVTSMPAVDVLPASHRNCFGFAGANGHRYANFVLGKSDLIIAMGTRLDLKQVGNNRSQFARQAKIIRVDIDHGNLEHKVHNDEIQFQTDIRDIVPALKDKLTTNNLNFSEWNNVCTTIKTKLQGYDDEPYTAILKRFSQTLPDEICITADVGQNEVWIAQQFEFKKNQRFHISAGHGAMGYSLPAAIGVYYASKKPVVSFNGDGGIQINIQELQFLAREKLPITVVIINNHSLGMIRGFQEANFEKNYSQTTETTGYSAPDFSKIAEAYELGYNSICSIEDAERYVINQEYPTVVEIMIPNETQLNPNFGRNGFIQDQRPYINRNLYEEIMNL